MNVIPESVFLYILDNINTFAVLITVHYVNFLCHKSCSIISTTHCIGSEGLFSFNLY